MITQHGTPDILVNFAGPLLTSSSRDGTCVRDYIHVLDLAAGHLLALEALSERSFQKTFGNVPEPNVNYKAYNLGKGRGQSVFEIVNAMTKASGYHFETDIVGRRLVSRSFLS